MDNHRPQFSNFIVIGLTDQGYPAMSSNIEDNVMMTQLLTSMLDGMNAELKHGGNGEDYQNKLVLYNTIVTAVESHLDHKDTAKLNEEYVKFLKGEFEDISSETIDLFIDIAVAENKSDSVTIRSIIRFIAIGIIRELSIKHQLSLPLLNYLTNELVSRLLYGRELHKYNRFSELEFNGAIAKEIGDVTGGNPNVRDFLIDYFTEIKQYYYESFKSIVKNFNGSHKID